MAKRGGSELNHENWNQEDEREDAGMFTSASASQMKDRVIKKARRRNAGDAGAEGVKKSAFASFGGFAGGNKDASATFQFLNKVANESAPAADKPAFGAFSFGSASSGGAEPAKPAFSFGSTAASAASTDKPTAPIPAFSFGAPPDKVRDVKQVKNILLN